MYSSLLWILFLILGVFLTLIFYLRQRQLQKLNTKSHNLFMTTQDALPYISKKANLLPEEQEKLEILLPLAGSNRLYIGFEDEEPAKKWLINTQRALYHSTNFDDNTKEDLVFTTYEIFRKIQLAKTLLNPTISSVKDIGNGQSLTISLPDNSSQITGELISTDLRTIQIMCCKPKHLEKLREGTKNNSKQVTVSFWKKMDAGYSFQAHIINISHKKDSCIVSLSHPNSIKRTNIRKHPRKDCMISCRFRVGSSHMNFNAGGIVEEFGAVTLGLINNIGAKGCNIITHQGIPNDSILVIDFPLFDDTLHIKGVIKRILAHDHTYVLNIEFTEEISRKDIVKIYHFVFSDINTV
ncbi:MAG: hypothetical protein ACRCTJ_00325 [Brevinema sp.]